MSSRLEAFREFISRHSSLRKEVLSGKKTWQNIYEDWVILGEENEIWNSYRNGNININTNTNTASANVVSAVTTFPAAPFPNVAASV